MLRTKIEIQNDKILQGNKLQRLSNIALQQIRSSLYSYTQRQTFTNSIQQKPLSQFQKEIIKQKFSSKNVYNAMNIESLKIRRKTSANSQQKQLLLSPQLQVQKQATKQKSLSKNMYSVMNVESLKKRRKTIANSVQQKQLISSPQLQVQKQATKQKSLSKNVHNVINVESLKKRRKTITNSVQQKLKYLSLSQFQKKVTKQKFSSKNVHSVESLKSQRKIITNPVQQLSSSSQFQKKIIKQKSSYKNVHNKVNIESLKERQKTITNPVHQKQILPLSQLQFQKEISKEKSLSKNKHNIMNVKSLKSSSICEKISINQQCSSSQSDSECKFSENDAFIKKNIHNLINNKVQHQIKGNIAKMLVVFINGEQRLITFEIPHEDCTVQDLLKQANIVLSEKLSVSLISNPTLDINYLVKIESDTITSLDMNKNDDNSQNNINNNSNNSSRSLDKNIDSVQQNKINNEHNSSTKSEKLEQDASMHKHKRKKRITSKSRPSHKKPECLTISSDEEEKSKERSNSNNNTFSNDTNNDYSNEMDIILEKKPIITNNSISDTIFDYAGCKKIENISDDIMQSPYISLLCKMVRIGSYKYIPRDRVLISQNGVRFGVPLLEDEKTFVTLDVKIQDIVKVLIHFGKSMPVLFFYTSINIGAMIRKLLGMQDPKGPYYDPAGKDHTHKRITLVTEKLSEESKVLLKTLFTRRNLLEELNAKEAHDIFEGSSPKNNVQMKNLSKKKIQIQMTANSNNTNIQTITIYPPPPAKGGIAISTEDYLCLGEDQFLNDVIIDFYLKYLTLEVLSKSDQQRTHVFSSYFYKRLTSPHAETVENNMPLTPAAKRHARVQKWTKNVNIFEKDFIIIPINEHAHWFLAIICFPGLVGKVFAQSKRSDENDIRKTVQKSKKLKEVKLQTVTIGSTTLKPMTTIVTIDQDDGGLERDKAESDNEEMKMINKDDDELEIIENTNLSPKMKQNILQEKDTIKIPCILIFDSLAGTSRIHVVATLRDYLSSEYVTKTGCEKVFSKDTIKGALLKVPQQSNFTDCGLYVLQYVESFFKNPIKDYTLPIKTLKNWFEEIVVTRKREELSKLLIKLMNARKRDKNITIPAVNFPTQDGKLKIKAKNHIDAKSVKTDVENKKKPTLDGENRISNNILNQSNKSIIEMVNKTTNQIGCIPFCSSENNSIEIN